MWPWNAVEWRLKRYIDGLQNAIAAQAEENSKIHRLVGMVEAQEIVIKRLAARLEALEDVRLWHNLDVAEANSATNGRSRKRNGRSKDALTPTNGRKSP